MANATKVQPPRTCKMRNETRAKQQLQTAESVGENIIEQQMREISKSETEVGENINAFKLECDTNSVTRQFTTHVLHG